MKPYHKIQTVYKRSHETNDLIEGEWSLPEFDLLKDIQWIWTEKIDGTNIRIIFNGDTVEFKGRTDKAELPKHLLKTLKETFTFEKMNKFFPE